jgi:OOP family OmpA-OmpF porin
MLHLMARIRASRVSRNSFNGTVGLTVYLGKNVEHADWVTLVDKDMLALTES